MAPFFLISLIPASRFRCCIPCRILFRFTFHFLAMIAMHIFTARTRMCGGAVGGDGANYA